jgi:hypothetical protein
MPMLRVISVRRKRLPAVTLFGGFAIETTVRRLGDAALAPPAPAPSADTQARASATTRSERCGRRRPALESGTTKGLNPSTVLKLLSVCFIE